MNASETATEDQASDYSSHTKQQRSRQFELEVTSEPPTSDQLRNIIDYVSPVSGVGGQGEKAVYEISELVKGAKDAEDALKKFKEDQGSFVRPIVSFFYYPPPPTRDLDYCRMLILTISDRRLDKWPCCYWRQ